MVRAGSWSLRGRACARGIFAALAASALTACRPDSESSPMPVIVRPDAATGGWDVVVPVCGRGDGITLFDLSKGGTASEGRWKGSSGPERRVVLHVNSATLQSGEFNNDEVKIVSHLPGALANPWVLTVFLTTVNGFAEFYPERLDLRKGVTYLVVGRSPPVAGEQGTDKLTAWCNGRRD